MTTAKQKEKVFRAAMRWYEDMVEFPISGFYDTKNLESLRKACAAAARGRGRK